jgi:hypothetical protein
MDITPNPATKNAESGGLSAATKEHTIFAAAAMSQW